MSDSVRYHVLVSGRVQGVGYRFFVIEEAERLRLNGWVRNLPDGRVEAEIEGPEESVQALLKELKAGPRLSHVTSVDAEAMNGLAPYNGFGIR